MLLETSTRDIKTSSSPLYFVKMYKDGTYECEISSRQELEQSTMELEYHPILPTDDEKIQYALNTEPVKSLTLSDDQKKQVAQMYAAHPDFFMPAPIRDDPEYFFSTPCKPVIWTWKKGTEEDAIAAAEAYRQKMLNSGKWDMVVAVYKQQYNVQEA